MFQVEQVFVFSSGYNSTENGKLLLPFIFMVIASWGPENTETGLHDEFFGKCHCVTDNSISCRDGNNRASFICILPMAHHGHQYWDLSL